MHVFRRGWRVAVAIGVLAAGSAWAQGRTGFRIGGDAILLSLPAVQTELKLTDEQKRQVMEMGQKMQADLPEFARKFQAASPDDQRKMVAELQAEMAKKLGAILNADQQKRLRQLG